MVCLIKVEPLGDGWRVSSDQIANDLLFRSGRQAEIAARRLAGRIAAAGKPAEIRIHLRDGALAARLDCPPRSRASEGWRHADTIRSNQGHGPVPGSP